VGRHDLVHPWSCWLCGFLTTLFTLCIVKVKLWWFCKVYSCFLFCEDSTADCLKLLLDFILGTWCDSYSIRSWVHSQLFLFVKGISLSKAVGHNIWPRLMAGAEFWGHSRLFSQLNWQPGDMRPQWTSTPSTGCPLLLSCVWTWTELIFGFTLVTNFVGNRSLIQADRWENS